jgi:hypothetical protein
MRIVTVIELLSDCDEHFTHIFCNEEGQMCASVILKKHLFPGMIKIVICQSYENVYNNKYTYYKINGGSNMKTIFHIFFVKKKIELD